MESLRLAVSVVLPLLIYMAVGGMIRKLGIFSQDSFKALNGMIFKIFLPLTLFFDVYEADLNVAIRPEIFVFSFAGVLGIYLLTWFIVSARIKENADASTMIQGIYRSNFVLFGNSIALSLCGREGQALVAALSALVVPMYNVLAVILFECKRGGNVKLSKIIVNILKNPLVDAGVLGCVMNVLHIRLPEMVMSPFERMGDIATPLALVVLGGLLSFGSIVKHKKYLIAAVSGRLVIVPLLAVIAAIAAGFRGEQLVAVLSIFAAPTAVASTPMAQSMGGNGALAGEIVVMTSACCILTIFLFVLGLSGLGMI